MVESCSRSEILFAIVSVPFVIYTGASFLINAATADEGIIIAIPATLLSLASIVFFLAAMCRCCRCTKEDKYVFKIYVVLAAILAILSTIIGCIQLRKLHEGQKYLFRSIVQLTYPFMCIICSILYYYVEQKDKRGRKYNGAPRFRLNITFEREYIPNHI